MMAPRIDTTIRLADGRRLAFAEYGEPLRADLRIIAPDRPGSGNSDA